MTVYGRKEFPRESATQRIGIIRYFEVGHLSWRRKGPSRRARSAAAVPGIDGGRAIKRFFVPRDLVATALLARDRAAIVSFDRGSHHAAISPWADGDAAWADADGDV
jgi:hypothetical protein